MSPPQRFEGVHPFTYHSRYLLIRQPARLNQPTTLVVALHGQGMNGAKTLELLQVESDGRHWLCPNGIYPFEKRKPGQIEIGYAWYTYTGDQESFRVELDRSEAHVLSLLDAVVDRHDLRQVRTVLLGYSQGGYLAGYVALRHPNRFQGLVLMGTRLKHEFLVAELRQPQLPAVLFVNSKVDPAVRWETVEPGVEALRAARADVTVEHHDEGHRIPSDIGPRLRRWLAKVDL